jgi:uncharacterized protein YbaR (Trm112 family)
MLSVEVFVCPKTGEKLNSKKLSDLPAKQRASFEHQCEQKGLNIELINRLLINEMQSYAYPIVENVPFLLDQYALKIS